ncbi:MAG: RluA family pseudouridine synthase [Caldilineaceae bacterium]
MTIDFTVDSSAPLRLDRAIRLHFPDWGRQAIQKLIASQDVKVNGRTVWLASWEVRKGDRIVLSNPPQALAPGPQRFEDAWLLEDTGEILAVNKPAGLLSEPTRWGEGVNLRDLAIQRFGPLILFHRLDRDTSGVILLTRPGEINKILDAAFKSHQIQKEYVALVHAPNRLAASGMIDLRLDSDPQRRDKMRVVEKGGKRAITRYEVEASANGVQQVRLWPQTGRTHQLRLHLAHNGAPILGDRLYGNAQSAFRLMLHAHQISVPVDSTGNIKSFVAPLPNEFSTLLHTSIKTDSK